MSKQFTYRNVNTGKIVFETTVPNYVSRKEVDKIILEKFGINLTLAPHKLECYIRAIRDKPTRSKKRRF